MPAKQQTDRTSENKVRYATDWVAFDKAAQARGAYRLQIQREAVPREQPAAPELRPGRGRQKKYSDKTVRSMLMLALVARLSLREVEGYVRALRDEADYVWDVPDHSTLCRRMRRLQVSLPPARRADKLVFLVDSTGLKVSGAGEWRARHARSGKQECASDGSADTESEPDNSPHKPKRPRRQWAKAHLAVEANTGLLVSAMLTDGHASDGAQLPRLLTGQPLQGSIVCADAAYHHEPEMQYVHRGGGRLLARPPYNAEPWKKREPEPAVRWRNLQIRKRNELGQRTWAVRSGYSRRSLIESHNARFKHYTGSSLRCRNEAAQQVELVLRAQLVNDYQSLWTRAGGTPARRVA